MKYCCKTEDRPIQWLCQQFNQFLHLMLMLTKMTRAVSNELVSIDKCPCPGSMTRTVITLLSSYDWRQKKDNCAFYSGVASVSTHTSHLTTITTDHWHWSLTLTAELILTDWVFSGSLWSGATAVTSPLLTNTQTDTTDYTLGTRWSITNQSLWFTENYVECCRNILIIF